MSGLNWLLSKLPVLGSLQFGVMPHVYMFIGISLYKTTTFVSGLNWLLSKLPVLGSLQFGVMPHVYMFIGISLY